MPFIAAGLAIASRDMQLRRRCMAVALLLAVCMLLWPLRGHNVWAQDTRLRVATIERVPFVVKQGTGFIGYSIELWDAVAKESGLAYDLVEFAAFADMLEAVKNGDADIAVANISVTAAREEVVDFSHAIFNAGLRILIHANLRASPSLGELLLSSGVLYTFGIALVILIIVAHLAWMIERRLEDSGFHQGYLRGIGDGFWWAAVTVTTIGYGDKAPRTIPGRVLGLVWMLAGLLILGAFIGQISSRFATARLATPIQGPADLVDFTVATVQGSTSDIYLSAQNLAVLRYDSPQSMFSSVLQGKADAAVFDAPIVAYFAATKGRGKVRVVGDIFQPQKFAFALTSQSPYRERINRALLKLRENGTVQSIYTLWFG